MQKLRSLTVIVALCLAAPLAAQEQDNPESAPRTTAAPQTKPPPGPTKKASSEPTPPPPANVEPSLQPAPAVFASDWKEASADEKAAFLEASPELRAKIQEKWNKLPAKQRKMLLKGNPLLANRPLKHRWEEATPEERIAFLNTDPSVRQRVRESWNLLTPEQRLQMVQKRPSVSRRALNHAWSDATAEEQTAFLESQPDLRKSVIKLWALASTSEHKNWQAATTEERTAFVERSDKTQDSARERWQKLTPRVRAQLVQKWSGWRLKMSAPAAKPSKKAAKGKMVQ